MPTVIENLNSVLRTKTELNTILRENGIDGGEVFSEYPDKFRSVIASGGGSDKVSYSYLNEKLSYYTTYTYIESKEYVQGNDFYDMALSYDLCTEQYVTDKIELTLADAGYISSIPSDYATYTGISGLGYVTSTDIENASYVSITSLSSMSYATTNQLPVIDENIIPKETNTYTLGSSTYYYNSSYTSNLYLGTYNIKDLINGMFSYDSTTGTLTITTLS